MPQEIQRAVLILAALGVTGLSPAARAQTGDVIRPNENLIAEGLPPIPAELARDAARYTEFRTAAFADWHPTERRMLISTRFGNTAQAHEVKTPGGDRSQVTFFPDAVSAPRYAPNGARWLVFAQDRGGSEFFQFYRLDRDTGKVTLLTDGKSRNTGAVWSPDGYRLAYTSTRRNGKDSDIWTMNPEKPDTDRLVMQAPGVGWSVEDWSPDGRSLVLGEYVSVNESYLWLCDAETGEKRALTPKASGGEPVAYSAAKFAPDGKTLYVVTDRGSEFRTLHRMDAATGALTPLSAHIPWDVESLDLSRDGRTLAFSANEDGRGVLHVMDARSGRERKIPALPDGSVGAVRFHKNGQDLAFGVASARTPADVYSLNLRSNKVERWTASETGGVNTEEFRPAELVRWKSFDGRTISGYLYAPPSRFAGRRPVIVNIHGGPEGQSRIGFLGRTNYLINEMGVAVLYPNVRGSSGYGKTFLKLDNGVKREESYRDIETLFDWLKTRPDLDAGRVMVTGGSYGGHMTFAAATRYPDRIACALAVVGMSNLVTFLERTEAYRRDLRRAEYGDERDPAVRAYLEKIAPLNNADRIKKPLFIVQGANDPRVPLNEAEQMKAIAGKGGAPVWYLVGKNEGHGFAKKDNADFQFYATLQFVKTYLLPN